MPDAFTIVPKLSRRQFLQVGGLGTSILFSLSPCPLSLYAQGRDETEIIEIEITNNYKIGRWFYDPVGVYVEPGQKIRWVGRKWGGSVTAFHPSNNNHELRIPESAKPFDSGILVQGDAPAARFEWVFEEEGTYDYFSLHHERLGAVGRIVVGSPGGPGEQPLGYGQPEGRAPIFADVEKLLSWLTSEKIVRENTVPYPMDLLERGFPLEVSEV